MTKAIGGRLWLWLNSDMPCHAMPAITFPAECHRPLASNKLYCLAADRNTRCEQQVQSCQQPRPNRELNPRPSRCKSNAPYAHHQLPPCASWFCRAKIVIDSSATDNTTVHPTSGFCASCANSRLLYGTWTAGG